MWNINTKPMAVTIGAAGIVSKSLGHYLNHVLTGHEAKKLQKTAILVTAHTLRKVLM